MKKLVLSVVVLMVFAVPGYAETVDIGYLDSHYKHQHVRTTQATVHDPVVVPNVKNADDKILGVKADAPNIIKLTENTSIGLEGGKDLNQTSADEGWFAYAKVTWTGSLLDFTK